MRDFDATGAIVTGQWKSNNELNGALCESAGKLVAFSEALFGGGVVVESLRKLPAVEAAQFYTTVAERMGAAAKAGLQKEGADPAPGELYEAKVGQADKMNQNRRVYTRGVWQKQIDRFNAGLKNGYLNGAVDHLGPVAGGNLCDTCIIHRDLRMDANGAVFSKFQIVEGHSRGKDLKAIADAGMKIGFSTFGYGTGHKPDESECRMYGIPEDLADLDPQEGGAVVMNDNYVLKKIDAVDDPSVADAYICDSVAATPVLEAVIVDGRQVVATAESCSHGLHWEEVGICGHVLSRCSCEGVPAAERHRVWKDKKCEKCAAALVDGLTRDQFVAEIRKARAEGRITEGTEKRPLARTYTQYLKGRDSFEPVGPMELAPSLENDVYNVVSTWNGVRFVRHVVETDELYHFSGSVVESLLKEVDAFWGMKEEYDKLGVMHNRGIITHGPPGSGKTVGVHQTADMVAKRGDVVFYAKSIGTLGEALRSLREVEPERKVLVCLEDADEYLGWQQREFLELLDGPNSVRGVLYLATTNYLERFPPRMIRSGRFDKKIYVGMPPAEGRRAYLNHKLAKLETPEGIEDLVTATDGLSFGDLRELVTAIYLFKEPKADAIARLQKGQKGGRTQPVRLEGHQGVTERAAPAPVPETQQDQRGDTDMTELEKLQKELADKQAELARVTSEKAALTKAVNPILEGLKQVPGVELPERAVLPAEIAERMSVLEGQNRDLTAQLESAKSAHKTELATVTAERDTLKAQFESIDRVKKVIDAAKPLLADHAYAPALKKVILETAKADVKFTADKVEAFIESKSQEYDLLNGGKRPKPAKEKAAQKPARPANGYTNAAVDWDDEDLAQFESTQAKADEDPEDPEGGESQVLAEAFGRKATEQDDD